MNLLHDPKLKHVISLSSFRVQPGKYVYCKIPQVIPGIPHLMIINDGEEITIVTEEKNLAAIGPHEKNKDRWRLVNIKCGNPFYCVGFIAGVTTALAAEGIDIVLTSSYSRDLVMVMEDDLTRSIEVLKAQGFAEE